jgi:UTP--glucose-1-phosphate uridylyltransferase
VIGDNPFAVLLGDDLIDSSVPCTRQLIDVYESRGTSVVGVMEVPAADVSKYGIVGGIALDDRTLKIDRMVEKPKIEDAPSRFAIPGRYVVEPAIFRYIAETRPGKGGEIQFTDALAALARNEGLLSYRFEGDRYDTGDRLGYLEATLVFGLRRPELRDGLVRLMKAHLPA